MTMSDPALSRIFQLHRLNGWTEPGHAMWAALQLMEKMEGLDQAAAGKRLFLSLALLRQAMVLNPFDAALRELVERVASVSPPSPGFLRWARATAPKPDQTNTISPTISLEEAITRVDQLGVDVEGLVRLTHPGSPPLLYFLALMKLWQYGLREIVLVQGEAFCATPQGSAAAPVMAWAAHACGQRELAARLAQMGPENSLTLNLKAETALQDGDKDQARSCFLQSLEFDFGQVFLLPRLAELTRPAPPDHLITQHRVHVAFYTYNKLEVTLETLASLLASDIGDAAVTLLNNGSTTFTPEELDQGVARIAQGRPVDLIHLPVNIGAPAARNWLWSLPASQNADYVAFLDDDVLLPKDWLGCYLQDFQEHPDLVVVGPKGMNPGTLPTIQYVYRYFQEVGEHKIRFTNNCPMVQDMGQFDYRRPCLSVMGCCHLFHRSSCEKLNIPGFDVRFSPSQVDDLEHDIQVWKAGGKVLYDGRVRVVHRQDAGRQGPQSEASWGHVWGNHMKMEYKLSRQELEAVHTAVSNEDDRFWREILQTLRPILPPKVIAFHETFTER
jgi:GT2 family glycosyltransferase